MLYQENGEESFEELQRLFEDMFQADIGLDGSTSLAAAGCSTSSTFMTYNEGSNSNKRNSSEMNFGKAEDSSVFDANYKNFCFGVSTFYTFYVFSFDIASMAYILHNDYELHLFCMIVECRGFVGFFPFLGLC